jgi:hypothetical protein
MKNIQYWNGFIFGFFCGGVIMLIILNIIHSFD